MITQNWLKTYAAELIASLRIFPQALKMQYSTQRKKNLSTTDAIEAYTELNNDATENDLIAISLLSEKLKTAIKFLQKNIKTFTPMSLTTKLKGAYWRRCAIMKIVNGPIP